MLERILQGLFEAVIVPILPYVIGIAIIIVLISIIPDIAEASPGETIFSVIKNIIKILVIFIIGKLCLYYSSVVLFLILVIVFYIILCLF